MGIEITVLITLLTVLLPILIVIAMAMKFLKSGLEREKKNNIKCVKCQALDSGHPYKCNEGFDLTLLGMKPLYCRKFKPKVNE